MPGGWADRKNLANPLGIAIDSTQSAGTDITTGTTANAYGSWTELYSAIPFDVTHLLIEPNLNTNSSGSIAYNIAAAPSGSEASGLIIENLVFSAYGGPINGSILLPVGPLPAGSRIAAQSASATPFDTSNLGLIGFDAGASAGAPAIWDTYGWGGSGAIQGVAVDPGATANTKGAYVTLVSSVTNDLRGFFLGFDYQNNPASYTFDSSMALVDLALGAAGAEVPILPNLMIGHLFGGDGSVTMYSVTPVLTDVFLMPIKAGTRIAVRAACSTATSPDRLIGVSLYGLRA